MRPIKQETNESQFTPTRGEFLSLFPTPMFRGQLNLNHSIVANDVRHLVSQSSKRHGSDDSKNYTTYFDEDLRTDMHQREWFRSFSNQIKDTYIVFISEAFGTDVGYLNRHDIHLFAWANHYTKPHQHEVHNHVNSFMSGTYYVTDAHDQPIKFWSPNLMAQFSHGSVDQPITDRIKGATVLGNNSTESEAHFHNSKGDFLIWPSYLQHAVPPIVTDVPEDYERISISFNLKHRLPIDSNETGDDMSYGFLHE